MKKWTVSLLLCLFSLLLVACGGKGAAEGEKKDSLVYAQISEGKTLDPQDTTEQYSQRSVTLIYSRLAEINETTAGIDSGLAKSWERPNPNEIIFHLRKDVKFSNGYDFTAEDVKFTIERAQSLPKVAHLYKPITEITIIDPYTISFKTEEPFAPLLNHLTHKTASILSKQYYEEVGDKYFENPVGTGPYMLKEWKIGDHIELEANPTYFDGEPSIKHVVFRGIPEESNKVIGLQTGEIDMVGDVEAVSRETISGDSNLELKEGSSVSTIYLGMNTERKIFADKDVRKAISMGVNRDDIVNSLLAGAGQKANSFLAPTVFGYSKDSKVYEYNPEEAKKIIEEKGLVGSKIKIAVSNSQLRSQMAEIIQAQLKEIGLEVSIENLEWGTFLSATANGEVDMFILGWGPSTYDGDYGLFPNFHSSQKGGSGNRSQYANPKMDQLLEEGRKEMDVEKRRDLYKQAADLINEEAVVLPLYYPLTSVGYRKAIKGVKAESYPMIHKYSY